jgi:hypothetical protein
MRRVLRSVAIAVASIGAVSGASVTVVSETGNDGGSNPLGYYAPYGASSNPGVAAVEWTQPSTFYHVTISADVWEPSGNPVGTVNYTLVTAIGSGASYATSGVAEGSATVLYDPGYVALTTLPSLGPGTYYLVLDSPSPNTVLDYDYPTGSSVLTTAPSVVFGGDYTSRGVFVNGGYTPGSSFFDVTAYEPFQFSVVSAGTSAAPEPSGSWLMALGILGVGVGLVRRRWVVEGAGKLKLGLV